MDDSGQVLALAPNRRAQQRNDFGGENFLAPFAQAPDAARNVAPATNGLRTSTKNKMSLDDPRPQCQQNR
jgi:hypothetical protein